MPTSSDDLAISVRGLGKTYSITSSGDQPRTLAEVVTRRLRHPFRRPPRTDFEALRDVNLDIGRGEVVGIIGRNGAGKSTLLKILSRITPPTSGEADIYGRTGSLLEVGTGFHPELTGRENIFLNGGILGMSREQIRRCFDAIVDFAGVEQFLDTPVKRYSSGMYVRLAFAIAAHLEPEVLIVDEVLAVGDAMFQKKCLGKMNETVESGRTVVFVSHNMGTVQSLCPRSILLQNGQVVFDGNTDDAVAMYLDELSSVGGTDTAAEERAGTGEARITDVRLLDSRGAVVTSVVGGDDLTIELEYVNPVRLRHPRVLANLYNARGVPVASISTDLTAADIAPLQDAGRLACHLPRIPLLPGRYRLAIALHADGRSADYLPAGLVFEVSSSLYYATGRVPDTDRAAFLLDHEWVHQPLEAQSLFPAATQENSRRP